MLMQGNTRDILGYLGHRSPHIVLSAYPFKKSHEEPHQANGPKPQHIYIYIYAYMYKHTYLVIQVVDVTPLILPCGKMHDIRCMCVGTLVRQSQRHLTHLCFNK